MTLITDEIRAAASEMYRGDDICREKSRFLLTEVGLPNGLLPLKDIIECGYIKDTGFVWLIQKKKSEHKFVKIGKPVQYAAEVTAYAEPGTGRIRKLTGVKAKEMLMWVTLNEIYVDDPPTGKITFKTPTGLFRTFPVDAFQIEEEEEEKFPVPDPAKEEEVVKEELKVTAASAVEVKEELKEVAAIAVEVKEV